MLSTPGSKAIVFSVITSSLITTVIFLLNGWRDKNKESRSKKLEKIEILFSKLELYSRESKKYMWSYEINGSKVVWNEEFSSNSREFIDDCNMYKELYFSNLKFDPSYQYAEMMRIAGDCLKHWQNHLDSVEMNVGVETIDMKLDVHKLIASEVSRFNELLKPIRNECLEIAKSNQ